VKPTIIAVNRARTQGLRMQACALAATAQLPLRAACDSLVNRPPRVRCGLSPSHSSRRRCRQRRTRPQSMTVKIKTSEEIEKMRIAGRLGAEVLDFITPHVRPGVTTGELDRLCHDYMVEVQGTVPAPLNYCPPGYTPFPKSVCTSVNHQVCHGIPGDKALKKGDILNIDVTV